MSNDVVWGIVDFEYSTSKRSNRPLTYEEFVKLIRCPLEVGYLIAMNGRILTMGTTLIYSPEHVDDNVHRLKLEHFNRYAELPTMNNWYNRRMILSGVPQKLRYCERVFSHGLECDVVAGGYDEREVKNWRDSKKVFFRGHLSEFAASEGLQYNDQVSHQCAYCVLTLYQCIVSYVSRVHNGDYSFMTAV